MNSTSPAPSMLVVEYRTTLHRVALVSRRNAVSRRRSTKRPWVFVANSRRRSPTRTLRSILLEHGECDHLPYADVDANVATRDTVSSVGITRGPTLPETTTGMTHVRAFRHALSLDDPRVKFLPEFANGGAGPLPGATCDVKEVWFVGSHSDVYVTASTQYALKLTCVDTVAVVACLTKNWTNSAHRCDGCSTRPSSTACWWLLCRGTGLTHSSYCPRVSSSSFWSTYPFAGCRTADPTIRRNGVFKDYWYHWYFLTDLTCRIPHHFGGRHIQPGQLIHSSVLDYMQQNPGYCPKASLPLDGTLSWDAIKRLKPGDPVIEEDCLSVETKRFLDHLQAMTKTPAASSDIGLPPLRIIAPFKNLVLPRKTVWS